MKKYINNFRTGIFTNPTNLCIISKSSLAKINKSLLAKQVENNKLIEIIEPYNQLYTSNKTKLSKNQIDRINKANRDKKIP